MNMKNVDRASEAISIIGGSDGPTSVFIAGRNKKTLMQKIQKATFQSKRKLISIHIKPNPHSMEEVMAYLQEKYEFTELDKTSEEYILQYEEMRASCIMQYAPELLGEYATPPQLHSREEEAIREFQRQHEIRQQKAMEIPKEVFEIDYHVFEKKDGNDKMSVYFETRFAYIGAGFEYANKATYRKFNNIYKDIYRYYGVTEEDIQNKTKRYKELLTTLTMK